MSSQRSDGVAVGSLHLTASTEKWLIEGLIAALPDLRLPALFAARRDMFRDAHAVTVATEDMTGTAVGVLSSRWCALPSGQSFLHVLTQFIGTRYQHGVVFRQSWRDHFAALGTIPELVVLKTYSPIVYCAMRAFTRIPGVILYPEVAAVDGQETAMAVLAAQIAQAVAAGYTFVPETGAIRDIGVPRDLYREMPRSSLEQANAHFRATTRPGDRILCVLRIPTEQARARIRAAFGLAVTDSAAADGAP